MTKAHKIADRVWGATSSSVTLGLFLLFVFWVVVQSPTITVQAKGLIDTYRVQAGSTVYIESPLRLSDADQKINLYPKLVSNDGQTAYELEPIHDAASQITHDQTSKGALFVSEGAGRPAYLLEIPDAVKKGIYEYRVEARYALNVLRDASFELPPAKIVVE